MTNAFSQSAQLIAELLSGDNDENIRNLSQVLVNYPDYLELVNKSDYLLSEGPPDIDKIISLTKDDPCKTFTSGVLFGAILCLMKIKPQQPSTPIVNDSKYSQVIIQ